MSQDEMDIKVTHCPSTREDVSEDQLVRIGHNYSVITVAITCIPILYAVRKVVEGIFKKS